MKNRYFWAGIALAAMIFLTGCTGMEDAASDTDGAQTDAYTYYPGSYTDPKEAIEKMELTPKSQKCKSCGKNNFKVVLVSEEPVYSAAVFENCIHGKGDLDQCEDIMMVVWDVCQDCTDPEEPWNSSAYVVKIGTRILCCEKTVESSHSAFRPGHKEIDHTHELTYPGSQTDPQTAMEVLKPKPVVKTCPVCEGTEIAVELVSEEPIYTEDEEIKCIHQFYGTDVGNFTKMLVRDVCQNCTDPEDPWTGEDYEYIIGGTMFCHGW